jgi:hypothetical protein
MRILALLVLVIGFLVVWQAWPVDPDLEAVCPPFGETESYTIETVWWPPGGERCTVGDGASKTTYPWREYLTVVLFALAVLVLRPRPVRLLASFALFLAGFAVFFGFVAV